MCPIVDSNGSPLIDLYEIFLSSSSRLLVDLAYVSNLRSESSHALTIVSQVWKSLDVGIDVGDLPSIRANQRSMEAKMCIILSIKGPYIVSAFSLSNDIVESVSRNFWLAQELYPIISSICFIVVSSLVFQLVWWE